MSNTETVGSPIDRSKRPRIETDEWNSDYEQEEHDDRQPKRQAIPDPETKAPYFNIKQEPIEGSISIRSLVNTRDAGIIIGKGGKNVNEIRELSTARVTVSEIVQGAHERILTVYGPLHAISRAFGLIGDKILYENPQSDETKNSEKTTALIKLLIPDSRMGILIGKGGSVIKSIQEQSMARLTASEEPLPMSSERIITVQGTPTSIEQAVHLIAEILLARFGKQAPPVIPYKPIPMNENNNINSNNSGSNNRQTYTNTNQPTVMMGYNGVVPVNMGQLYHPSGSVMYGGMVNPRQRDYGVPNMVASQTQQIFIPNEMVGSIIGKRGSKINEIRQRSGSQIKIDNPQNETSERLITITGSPERNQMALYLLYSRLESEKNRLGIR